jgi:hypothetical protein
MLWRTNKNAETLLAIQRLERRFADIEGAIVVICDHVEALEAKPAIARLLQQWTPDTTRPT